MLNSQCPRISCTSFASGRSWSARDGAPAGEINVLPSKSENHAFRIPVCRANITIGSRNALLRPFTSYAVRRRSISSSVRKRKRPSGSLVRNPIDVPPLPPPDAAGGGGWRAHGSHGPADGRGEHLRRVRRGCSLAGYRRNPVTLAWAAVSVAAGRITLRVSAVARGQPPRVSQAGHRGMSIGPEPRLQPCLRQSTPALAPVVGGSLAQGPPGRHLMLFRLPLSLAGSRAPAWLLATRLCRPPLAAEGLVSCGHSGPRHRGDRASQLPPARRGAPSPRRDLPRLDARTTRGRRDANHGSPRGRPSR